MQLFGEIGNVLVLSVYIFGVQQDYKDIYCGGVVFLFVDLFSLCV